MASWLDRLTGRNRQNIKEKRITTLLRSIVAGSFYKISDLRTDSSLADIQTQIDTMRALARDSQIATALSYYATDATTVNSSGDIIWATPIDPSYEEVAQIINTKFKQWSLNTYVRDHILELATIGNLYLPTTDMYRVDGEGRSKKALYSLDHNSIVDESYEIVPSYKIPPEDIIHLWYQGKPQGFVIKPDEKLEGTIKYPEESVIHFTLGGLLGDYTIDAIGSDNQKITYDIQFGQPLMEAATQPTQTLSLLEDALVLSSLTRIVRFINVECGNAEEEEIQATLQQIKDMVEQQLSINTATGDAQSFVNPQSPNNLIYLPRINGQDAISVTDLDMTQASDADNNLLSYYQDKKLSVLGVPKEAMNFSSAEGLGGAGAVMSQRSALYANALQRIETAYIAGWQSGMNKYFIQHNLSGYVDKFELHMNPIITQMSTVNFDRRDSALSQATNIVEVMKGLGVDDATDYKSALTEVLSEVFPKTGTDISSWDIDVNAGGEGDVM